MPCKTDSRRRIPKSYLAPLETPPVHVFFVDATALALFKDELLDPLAAD
jgi:hypothetical protein